MKRTTFFADEQHMDELKEIAREERKTLDTRVLYALADRMDAWHRRCADFVEEHEGRLLVPSTVISEACSLMGTISAAVSNWLSPKPSPPGS